jgi:hypothetical protein
MKPMRCSNMSVRELLRYLSPLERRAYWHGRQLLWFALRKRGCKTVYEYWRT